MPFFFFFSKEKCNFRLAFSLARETFRFKSDVVVNKDEVKLRFIGFGWFARWPRDNVDLNRFTNFLPLSGEFLPARVTPLCIRNPWRTSKISRKTHKNALLHVKGLRLKVEFQLITAWVLFSQFCPSFLLVLMTLMTLPSCCDRLRNKQPDYQTGGKQANKRLWWTGWAVTSSSFTFATYDPADRPDACVSSLVTFPDIRR